MRKVVDLHCDTLMKLAKDGNLSKSKGMVTLEGLQKGGVSLQCFADFVPTGIFPEFCRNACSTVIFEKLYRNFRAMMELHKDILFPVLSRDDVDRMEESDKIGVLLTIEDGGVLGKQISNLKEYYDMGVRMITLTWNHSNAIGFPNSKNTYLMEKGLTDFGIQVVKEMQNIGMIVDVSHVSDGVFWDVIRISEKPFVASHSNARTICDHTRNMTDEMIKALAEKGGIMGINVAPEFLLKNSKESYIEDMIRHITHIRNIAGIEVLALGSDFDGVQGKFELAGPQDWPKLETALKKVGFSDDDLDKMWWMNAKRVLKSTLK